MRRPSNSWPFLYEEMEHEITDPSPLYFANGNVYNPLIQRLLSQVGQQPISVPPGQGPGEGFGGFGPSETFGIRAATAWARTSAIWRRSRRPTYRREELPSTLAENRPSRYPDSARSES